MAARKKKDDGANQVVVIMTTNDELMIRSNPSDEEVRGFVAERQKRYRLGQPGGPDGAPVFEVWNAFRWKDELSYLQGAEPVGQIDISDLLHA